MEKYRICPDSVSRSAPSRSFFSNALLSVQIRCTMRAFDRGFGDALFAVGASLRVRLRRRRLALHGIDTPDYYEYRQRHYDEVDDGVDE